MIPDQFARHVWRVGISLIGCVLSVVMSTILLKEHAKLREKAIATILGVAGLALLTLIA